jgi:predicted ATP-grasp superfamily ATP-dependent carboligase
MPITDIRTPVLLLRAVGHSGLGIVRSLGSLGVPVYSLEAQRVTPASYSRYSTGHFTWDIQGRSAEESIRFLINIARKLGRRALLFPTRDHAAIFIAENSAALQPWFDFPRQPVELVHRLCSKKAMHEMALSAGVPVPTSCLPQSRREAADFCASAQFPILVKAIDGDRMVARIGKRQFLVDTIDELLRIYDAIADPENIMLQEYIPGPEENCWIFQGYFDHNSACLAAYTGQKLRQCRAYGGDTCLGVSSDNAVIKNTVAPFLTAIGYRGLVDLCIRYDPRDGRYKVLDINPRIGANARIFVSETGLDQARIYYADMTGQTCSPEPVNQGRKWLVEDYDVVSCVRYGLDGNLGLREWVKSFSGVRELAYLSARDPMPVLARLTDDVREISNRLFRHRQPHRAPATHPEAAAEIS